MPDTLTWEGGSSIHKAAKTRYYFGAYERTVQNNIIQEIDYIITPAGLTAMRMYNDAEGLEKIYYLHTDNLGSIQAVTDENRNLISRYYYTPWGARELLAGINITDRGYTFHEHLEPFGLINMNGRVYDPVLARFLSPDPYVQAPDYTQNFNRYSYCYNNPFKYTDPSGEWVHIVIGAAIGGVINLTIKAIQGEIHNFGDGLVAFGIGALAGGVGAATGGAAFLAAGGGAAGVGGFLAGATGGLAGSAFASPIQSMGNSMYFGDPLMTGKEFLMGLGIGALTGGTFNGISALAHGRTFWSGQLPSSSIQVQMPTVDVGKMVSKPEDASKVLNNKLSDHSSIKYEVVTDNSKGGMISHMKDGNSMIITRPEVKGYLQKLDLKTDAFHQFPKDFDKQIIQHGVGRFESTYTHPSMTFTAPGTVRINSDVYKGIYEVGVRLNDGIVIHRFFNIR